MTKPKEYICGYSHCKHDNNKVPSDEAIKDGTRYYHKDCLSEKQMRKQIFDIYYKHYKSTEDYSVVNGAINGFISNSTVEYVLYVLCYAIREKIPFKGIFTLGWLVKNNEDIKNKYISMKIHSERKDIEAKMNKEINPINCGASFKFTPSTNNGFGKILGGE